MAKRRKPTHPGEVLEAHYIEPLNLNLEKLAERLAISRKTLHKIRRGTASVTVAIAISLAQAFDTTPEFWLNLQNKYDLWVESQEHSPVKPLIKNGEVLPSARNIAIAASPRK